MTNLQFSLRKWTIEDASSFFKYINNKNVSDWLSDLYSYPYTEKKAYNNVSYLMDVDESELFNLAIDVGGEAVGCVAVKFNEDIYCKAADIGYWLGEEFWSKGIMTNSIKQICKIVFENYDIARISAEVVASNIASIKVLEKSGFTYEGTMKKSIFKNGIIFDSHMYGLTI